MLCNITGSKRCEENVTGKLKILLNSSSFESLNRNEFWTLYVYFLPFSSPSLCCQLTCMWMWANELSILCRSVVEDNPPMCWEFFLSVCVFHFSSFFNHAALPCEVMLKVFILEFVNLNGLNTYSLHTYKFSQFLLLYCFPFSVIKLLFCIFYVKIINKCLHGFYLPHPYAITFQTILECFRWQQS